MNFTIKNKMGILFFDWKELEKEYSKEKVKEYSERTACGCFWCTKRLLELDNVEVNNG